MLDQNTIHIMQADLLAARLLLQAALSKLLAVVPQAEATAEGISATFDRSVELFEFTNATPEEAVRLKEMMRQSGRDLLNPVLEIQRQAGRSQPRPN